MWCLSMYVMTMIMACQGPWLQCQWPGSTVELLLASTVEPMLARPSAGGSVELLLARSSLPLDVPLLPSIA